jgi:hypothetical protein
VVMVVVVAIVETVAVDTVISINPQPYYLHKTLSLNREGFFNIDI